MTDLNEKNEDLELEEGEIAEDSNDDDPDMNENETDEPPVIAAEPSTSAQDPAPQKKRKKVIRKVRRKIKVKRKVPKKKDPAPQAPENNIPFVNLWEQQISMLQELQRAQLLRAAATDEDLRIFPNSILAPTPLSSIPVSAPISVPVSAPISASMAISAPVPLSAPALVPVTAPALGAHQTPSSPDDENGKPSYEAISKMLTLLRNSVNDPESSDMQSSDNTNNIDSANSAEIADTKPSMTENPNLLIPILVEGIDYTKYKLLSRYEPKLKNDPRLCQQS